MLRAHLLDERENIHQCDIGEEEQNQGDCQTTSSSIELHSKTVAQDAARLHHASPKQRSAKPIFEAA